MPDVRESGDACGISLVLLGGGGHARVLLDVVELTYPAWRVAVLTRNRLEDHLYIGQVHFRGCDEHLEKIARFSRAATFVVAVGSTSPGPLRKALYDRAVGAGLLPQALLHPDATISPRATIGPGAQVLARSVINSGARVGSNVIVNTSAVIEHDCVVEAHGHISPGAVLSGGVFVGEGAHVGVGAVVRQGIRIGPGAQVGAGAVVVRDVAPGTTVVGIPARPILGGRGMQP